MKRWGGLQRAADGSMWWHGPDGLVGPIKRCACPDGCATGWGWKDGLCGACHRDYVTRTGRRVSIEAYRVTVQGEPFAPGAWLSMTPAARAEARRAFPKKA